MKRIPLEMVTVIDPIRMLGLVKEGLPEPAERNVDAMNQKRAEEAKSLGIESRPRNGTLDNGAQIHRNKKVGGEVIARILAHFDYAIFVKKGIIEKIEFRLGEVAADAPGLLSGKQWIKIMRTMTFVDLVYLKGLWVNPREGGEVANLVLSPVTDGDYSSSKNIIALRDVIEDSGVMYVEVPD